MTTLMMTVMPQNTSIPMSVSEGSASIGLDIDLQYIEIQGEPYEGSYTVTPGTQNQTLSTDGKTLNDDITVYGDPDLIASNIVYGKEIFGVNGSARVPVVSQDSTTKVLSITG